MNRYIWAWIGKFPEFIQNQHNYTLNYLVVVDQFTPVYLFTPTLSFLKDLWVFIEKLFTTTWIFIKLIIYPRVRWIRRCKNKIKKYVMSHAVLCNKTIHILTQFVWSNNPMKKLWSFRVFTDFLIDWISILVLFTLSGKCPVGSTNEIHCNYDDSWGVLKPKIE